MLVEKHKLKRDYKISWTETYKTSDGETHYDDNECIIEDCETEYLAWQTWYENVLEYDYDCVEEYSCEAIGLSHQDRINAEVYELVLAELFEGKIAVYERVYPQIHNDFEITPELEGLEKMLVEHQALLKYNKMKG